MPAVADRWWNAVRQPQGFLSAFVFAGLVALLYYLFNRGNEEALSEVGRWVAYVLPAFFLWLAGIWVWFLLRVPAELAYENERASATLSTRVTELEERLRPQLRIEGGNGSEFDWGVPIMQVYDLLQKAKALAAGEYVMSAAEMKVLRIRNASDVGIEGVRVDVTLNDVAIPVRLTWFHNELQIADIAPLGAQHVVVGMRAKLGFSMPGGGQREYDRGLWYHDLAPGTVFRVKAWTPGGPAASAAFRVGPEAPASAGSGLSGLIYESRSWRMTFTEIER